MSKTKVDLFEGNLYEGSRGEDFKEFIISLLKKGKLKDKYIKILTTEEAMEKYGFTFTAESRVHPENNYECYEQMGDKAASHFMASYFFRRFPQLECSAGNKVVCRLGINYGAKQSFSSIATELGFWKFITCPETGNKY
jgi:dsRNA-specific ribonuclease